MNTLSTPKRLGRFAIIGSMMGLCLGSVASAQLSGGADGHSSFLDEARQVELLQNGNGWKKLRIYDQESAAGGEVMIAVTRQGLYDAPLPASEIDELRQDFGLTAGGLSTSANGGMILVHQELAELKAKGGNLPSRFTPYVENSLGGCFSWNDKQKSENWSFDGWGDQHSFDLTNNVSGSYSVRLPVVGQATAQLKYQIKKAFCVPYKFRFVEARAFGNLSLDGDSLLDASVSLEGHWKKEWRLANPRLGGFTVWLGPVPVKVDFYLPIDAGVSLDVLLTGTLSVEADYGASGNFDYTCNKDTCWGSSDFTSFDMVEVTSSIELDIDARVWARAMIRAEIYDDSILYAGAGIKGFVDGELWGYYGNACGDADGDGQNETVEALAVEARAGYDFAFEYGGIIFDDRYWESNGGRYYLGWWDLLGEGGSTALSPIVEGPDVIEAGQPAEYTVRMRPCYKYDEAVNLTMTPGNWQGELRIPNPKSNDPTQNRATLEGTFDENGWYTIQARALSDAQGRRLRATTEKPVQVMRSFCDGDTAAPSVSITSPSNGATLPFGPRVIQASASDDLGIEKVQFFVDGVLVGSDTEAPFTHNWTATPGSHVLRARVWDLCAKVDNHVIGVTVEDVDVCDSDSTPPAISLDSPADGALLDPGNVTITASASDANGIGSVQFLVDGTSIGTDTTAPFSKVWNAGEGGHNLQVKATDGCGLQSIATVSVTVEGGVDCATDNLDPTISMTSPSATDSLTPGFITISADASDASGIEKVQFFVDDALLHADFSAPYSYAWNASPGTHTLKVRAIDTCGRQKAQTRTVTVGDPDGCSADSVRPAVHLVTPAPGAQLDAGQATMIEATATDASGIERMQFFVDNQLLGVDAAPPFQFQWTPTAGGHAVKARAWDNCGNFRADTHNVTAQ